MRKNRKEKGIDSAVGILVRELATPFLGSLLPGVYLWLGILLSVLPPIYLLLGASTFSPLETKFDFLSNLSVIVNDVKSGSWVLFIIIAYVLGAIVSKQDPKITDGKSFKRISKTIDNNLLATALACSKVENCEYPYPNLSEYFEERGLHHLVPLVPWREDSGLKSKAYINKLKLHVELGSPYAYRALVRNEAHIRLTNTVWHGSILIRYCSMFGIFVASILVVFLLATQDQSFPLHVVLMFCISAFVFPALVLLVSEFIRINVEKIFHWQRLRELFFVFETYYKVCHKPEDQC